MFKPALLRAALTAAVPHLQRNPEALHIFIDAGRIHSTGAGGLSFEYAYTLNVIVTDYGEHADTLMVPILSWLREQQPELLLNSERMADGFTFEADILSHQACDISVKLKLSERVRVVQDAAGVASITHLPEPPVEEPLSAERWALFYGPDKVKEWTIQPVESGVG